MTKNVIGFDKPNPHRYSLRRKDEGATVTLPVTGFVHWGGGRVCQAAAILILAAVVACNEEAGQPDPSPATPNNTATQAPTAAATEVPAETPTVAPTETPASMADVRAAFDAAYGKLSAATLAALPTNQTRAYIEERLSYCNAELVIQDIPLDHPNYNYALINACILIPQEVAGIPGHADIPEFAMALDGLGSFTMNKVDQLWESGALLKEENGQVLPISESEFAQYRSEVASFFPR